MIEDRLHALVRRVLAVPARIALNDSLGPRDVPGWDSVGGLKLALAVEEAYTVEFPIETLAGIDSIGALRRAIVRCGGR